MEGWGGLGIMLVLGVAFGGVSIILSSLVGPRNPTPEKEAPYECGMPPVGDARERQSVKFYLIAMIFLLFDIEVAFLYPWAMAMRDLSWTGFFQIFVFFSILVVGYIYVWRKGVLDWGPQFDPDYPHRPAPGPAVVKRYRYGNRV
ncbi:MAG: NADH-quinone oxidoreductase subunit A [Vicinamibacterales bacterium]